MIVAPVLSGKAVAASQPSLRNENAIAPVLAGLARSDDVRAQLLVHDLRSGAIAVLHRPVAKLKLDIAERDRLGNRRRDELGLEVQRAPFRRPCFSALSAAGFSLN